MRKNVLLSIKGTLILIAVFLMMGCVTNQFADDPLETVEALNLERYLGEWYEIARFQSGFEKNIFGATAEYSLREDGRIKVLNSGFKKNLDGPYTSIEAVAWRPDDNLPGELKVRFFKLFNADYFVFGLDHENYQWALVGNNERKFLWFLSRTPEISEKTLNMMKEMALEQGYDLTNLFFVPQKQR